MILSYRFKLDLPLTLTGSELNYLRDELRYTYEKVLDTGSYFIIKISKKPDILGGTWIFIQPKRGSLRILTRSVLSHRDLGVKHLNTILRDTSIGDKLREYLDRFGSGQKLLNKITS